MNKDINPQQETSTTKRKHSIKPNNIKWNLILIDDVYEKWYRKYSSMPITKIIFENFLLNKRAEPSRTCKHDIGRNIAGVKRHDEVGLTLWGEF